MLDKTANGISGKPDGTVDWRFSRDDFMEIDGRFGRSRLLNDRCAFIYEFPTSDVLGTGDFTISFWMQALDAVNGNVQLFNKNWELMRLEQSDGSPVLGIAHNDDLSTSKLVISKTSPTDYYNVQGLTDGINNHERMRWLTQYSLVREGRTIKLIAGGVTTIAHNALPDAHNFSGVRLVFPFDNNIRTVDRTIERVRVHNRALKMVELQGLSEEESAPRSNYNLLSRIGEWDVEYVSSSSVMMATAYKVVNPITISAVRFRGSTHASCKGMMPFIAKAINTDTSEQNKFSSETLRMSEYLYSREGELFPAGERFDSWITLDTPILLEAGDFIMIGVDAINDTSYRTNFSMVPTTRQDRAKVIASNSNFIVPLYGIHTTTNASFPNRIGSEWNEGWSSYSNIDGWDIKYSSRQGV